MSVTWHQKTHGVLRRREHANRTVALLFFSVVAIISLLAAAYLGLVAANVRLSRQVWAMEEELVALQRDGEVLHTEIARESSIPVLQERSVQLGYQPADSVDYVHMGGQ